MEGNSALGQLQSILEIEWITPPAQGRGTKQIVIALQSLSYSSPVHADELSAVQPSSPAPGAISSGPLAGGILGDPGSVTGSESILRPVNPALSRTTARSPSSNAALLSMPTVMAAASETSAAVHAALGLSGSSLQLFRTGRGEVISAAGTKLNLEILSYFTNDTVLTSFRNDFEISSGARMQFLVGVQK
jgi:hypothetical protein